VQSEDKIRQRKDSSYNKSAPAKIPKNKLMLGKNYSGLAKEKEDILEQKLEKPAVKRDLFYFKSSLVSSNENEINY
jgi:hypothetical protein